ncbi:MAG: DNA-binding transcriptional activator of the family [Chthonomonadales bacterium]|nr:DNA-binding transcriptional activator of the family [Chthonomonadales bacterium]
MNETCAITLFGGLQVQQGSRRISRFRTYKTGALLAYLAFYPEMPHSREVLAELFWPDSKEGRLSLRVSVGSLRRQLEAHDGGAGGILVAERATICLNPLAVCVDVAEFEEALRTAAQTPPQERMEWLARAVELYRGPLLPGYYEDWVLPERDRLAEAYVGALHQLCTLLETSEDRSAALSYGHRAIIAAPFEEKAHVALMRVYSQAGRPMDALRHYEKLECALVAEWGDSRAMPAAGALAEDLRRRYGMVLSGGKLPDTPSTPVRDSRTLLAPETTLSVVRPLPHPFTRLFGREEEISSLQRLCLPSSLSPSPDSTLPLRLITITGQGGIGKTRLAIEVAGRCSKTPGLQVRFVSLTNIADPNLMPDTIADGLGIGRAALADPIEQIVQALSSGPSLLILDNMEHLLTENPTPADPSRETRAVVRHLMEAVPDLTVLVTSRQSLEIEGETVFPLSSLPVSPPGEQSHRVSDTPASTAWAAQDVAELWKASPSVQMFVDRAQAVLPDFQLNSRNAAAVTALCARLEGVPLFIELAAAWAQTYTPAQMLSHLPTNRLLVSRRKDRPERQRSVHAVVDWSFQILTPLLQRFFARLSIFMGGWTLSAAEEICEEPEAMSALGELHARSMLVAEEQGEAMRYHLPEALRQYAASRLNPEEQERLAARHAAFALRLAEQGERELAGADQKAWLERLGSEQDNLRAALAWSGSCETGVRLAGALCKFWEIRGEATEGRRRLNAALDGAGDTLTAVQAKAKAGLARLAMLQGDLTEARLAGEASWRAFSALREDRAAATAGTLLSRAYHLLGEQEKGRMLLTDCLALCRQVGGSEELASTLMEQGHRHGYYGEYDSAEACLGESRELLLQRGDIHGMAWVATEQAIIKQYRQDFPAANAFYEQALALFQTLGDCVGASEAMHGIGYVARLRGDLPLAAATLEKFLALQRQLVLKGGILKGVRNLGCVMRDQGDYKRAMTLLEEGLMLARASGELQMEAETLGSMAIVACYSGDYRKSRALHEKCLQFRRGSGYRQDIAESLGHLAFLDLAEGNRNQARALLTEGLMLCRAVGVPIGAASHRNGLSVVALLEGEVEEAADACRESLRLLQTTSSLRETIDALEQMARVCHLREAVGQAACLLSASETLRRHFGFRKFPFYQSLDDQLAAALRNEMEAEALRAALDHGAEMTLAGAVDYALEVCKK